jgi:hypothetical protein
MDFDSACMEPHTHKSVIKLKLAATLCDVLQRLNVQSSHKKNCRSQVMKLTIVDNPDRTIASPHLDGNLQGCWLP